MNNQFIPQPNVDELPCEYAERLGILYSRKVDKTQKKNNGQFFTPIEVAKFMSTFCSLEQENIKILDPGCGIGILSIALIEKLVTVSKERPKLIELVVFELDTEILPFTEACFEYLRVWLTRLKVNFTVFICKNDFVMHNSLILNETDLSAESYDIVISNPPYFKLPKGDERVIAAKKVIHGQSNIYSIFLLIAALLLKRNGQLIFITPRSFCSGNYFRLFREIFFSKMVLENIHLFKSRKDAFKKDKVLQENLIITAHKNIKNENLKKNDVMISHSSGIADLLESIYRPIAYNKLIDLNSYQKTLHLPTSNIDDEILAIFKNWKGSFADYKIKISTGPVVYFRYEKYIREKKSKETVPLIWLHNVDAMKLSWPKIEVKKDKVKGQYIVNNDESKPILVKNQNCVIVRRFSTKDDNRRLVATPYIRNKFEGSPMIGIENHLNYIYREGIPLNENESIGISGILNSFIFDLYFRTFNGNINVSATELREIPLPPMNLISNFGHAIANNIKLKKDFDIDILVSEFFNLPNYNE